MIAVDTSVVVAALLSWHERHEVASRALAKAMSGDPGLVLPVPVLVETYAVLTRLPPPHRLSPADALALVRENFTGTRLATFTSRSAWPLLARVAGKDIAGGATYDAIILEAAQDAGATALLTMNPRDFERMDADIAILQP